MIDRVAIRLSDLAGDFVIRIRRVALVAGSQIILPADLSRFSLLFTLSGFASATVWPAPSLALNEGITLSTTTPFQITYRDYGPALGFEWSAHDGFGGAILNIIEVCYAPGGNV